MRHTHIGLWHPQIMGHRYTNIPWLDPESGETLPLCWVECAGCGGEVPTEPGSNGSRPLRLLHMVRAGGHTYYASPQCVKRAAARLGSIHGAVEVITTKPVEFIPLNFHVSDRGKKQEQEQGEEDHGDTGG